MITNFYDEEDFYNLAYVINIEIKNKSYIVAYSFSRTSFLNVLSLNVS